MLRMILWMIGPGIPDECTNETLPEGIFMSVNPTCFNNITPKG